MSITVIGTIFTDIKGYPLGKFVPDGRNSGKVMIVHGGVARNVAEDLAHLSMPPVFCALADHSSFAADVKARLNKSGVDTRFVFNTDSGMGTWMAVFDEKGDVAANISVRPDLSPLTGLLEEHEKEIFADADSIILEIDIEPETVATVFRYAKKYGKKVYALVSVMAIALKRRAFFPQTECFICNLQEAGMMFETDFSSLSLSALEENLDFLARKEGFSKLIVTLAERGAIYIDCRNDISGYCPAKKVTLKDSTGAGDAFCAGAAAALTAGWSMEAACKAGSRVAAAVITSTENVCPEMEMPF